MADTVVEAVDRHLHRLVPFGFSGAVLVVDRGSRIHAAGYGPADRRTGRTNTPGTAFDIGSLSKQFTATAVIALEERGLLTTDDSLGDHLPAVPADKRGITIDHLLTQTSGLPTFHDTAGDFQVMDRVQAERAILDARLAFEPGEAWSYSNSGYTLLAAIVERVSGRPFEAVLRDELFEPAGLQHTGLYFQDLWRGTPVARGYRDGSAGAADQGSPLEWTDTEELWALIGNGGVVSTLDDLERWHRALRGGTVLPQKAVERLFAPRARVREGLHYGYGWMRDHEGPGGPTVRHGGANDFGFASDWRWYEERDLLVVLLVNREPPGMDVSLAVDAVRSAVEAALVDEPPEPPPETTGPTGGGVPDALAGRYRFEDGGELVVRPAPGALAVEPRTPQAVRYLAFPRASPDDLEAIRRLDRRSAAILDGIADAEYGPLREAIEDRSRFEVYRDFAADWWSGIESAGASREDVVVMGTVPIWWSPGDDRLATVIRAAVEERSEIFRLHWRDGRIAGLGRGAVREPATTLFAPAGSNSFVGYHLGIREPVRLTFREDPDGGETTLRLRTGAGPMVARQVRR